MRRFVQRRHVPPHTPPREVSLVLLCESIRSRANLGSLVRLAGCFGLGDLTVAGPTRPDPRVARDALEQVELRRCRTLAPRLERLRAAGYECVGLEQASGSQPLPSFAFPERTALVVGNERRGL